MMSRAGSKIANVALYQLGWFFCVLGAAYDFALYGTLIALIMIGMHLILTDERQAEIRLLLCTCILGVVVDSSQQALGVFSFKSDPDWPLWLPAWIFVIWAQFATLFRYALYWLRGRYLLAALFGLLGGPLAYAGGVRLGAAQFGADLSFSLVSLALVWACVTPLLVWLSARFSSREGHYRTYQVQ